MQPCLSKLGGVAREVRLPHIGRAGGSAASAALCTPTTPTHASVLLVGPALIGKAHFLVVRRWARAAAANVHTAGAHPLTHGRRGARSGALGRRPAARWSARRPGGGACAAARAWRAAGWPLALHACCCSHACMSVAAPPCSLRGRYGARSSSILTPRSSRGNDKNCDSIMCL